MIYEYECEKCGKIVEAIFKIGEAEKTVDCDSCKGVAKRVFSNAGFVLKGPGDHWPSQQSRRKNEMTKRNVDAGNRGREDWRKRIPKLKKKDN